MDGQSVKTTERGGVRGFDGHKRVKGRKRHILVDTLGFPIACRIEPANTSDRRAAVLLLSGLRPLFPAIRTDMADAGHESTKLALMLKLEEGWELRIIGRILPFRAGEKSVTYVVRLKWKERVLEQGIARDRVTGSAGPVDSDHFRPEHLGYNPLHYRTLFSEFLDRRKVHAVFPGNG